MIDSIFYLCLNALRTYTIYRFVSLFFDKQFQRKNTIIGYLIYFIINSSCYLLINKDILNLLTNVGGLMFVILFLYRGSFTRKILALISSFGMALLTENIAWIVFVKEQNDSMAQFGFFFAVFLLFLFEIVIEKSFDISKGYELSMFRVISLVFISFGSMLISSVLIETTNSNKFMLITSLFILLIINITVFYLYDKLLNDFRIQMNENVYKSQLRMYKNQLQLMKNASDSYYSVKHDMTHHLLLLKEYIENDHKDKSISYINRITDDMVYNHGYISSKNECIDSILNYFITEVKKIDGQLYTEVIIPEKINIDEFDLNVILSNLLMNSYEAIKSIEKKEINIKIKYDRGTLHISTSNPYSNHIEINPKTNGFLSSKPSSKEHGIGLANVRRTVEKYNGNMNIDFSDNLFKVSIFLFI